MSTTTLSSLAFTDLHLLPDREEGKLAQFEHTMTLPTSLNSGDVVTVMTVPAGRTIVDAWLTVDGTLGTSCTVQLRQGTVTLTPATTAAAAGAVRLNRRPIQSNGLVTANLLVGGNSVGTSANATVTLLYIR